MRSQPARFALVFFSLNLFFPLAVQIGVAIIGLFGPNLRTLAVALPVIFLINVANISLAFYHKAWQRVALITITLFNAISVFAMGGLSFLTSVAGWEEIVPDLVSLILHH
jgi:cytochrome c oxidase subunit IV